MARDILPAKKPGKEKLWWEKTVEYKYVLEHFAMLPEGMYAPMDGDAEQLGDGGFKHGDKFNIIEFKRYKTSINDEKKKFSGYTNFETRLKQEFSRHKKNNDKETQYIQAVNLCSHHCLVYGVRDKDGNLKLEAMDYIYRRNQSLPEICKKGLVRAHFKKYVGWFIGEKNRGGGGGNNMFSDGDFSSLVCLSTGGGSFSAMTLKEFCEEEGINIAAHKEDIDKDETRQISEII